VTLPEGGYDLIPLRADPSDLKHILGFLTSEDIHAPIWIIFSKILDDIKNIP